MRVKRHLQLVKDTSTPKVYAIGVNREDFHLDVENLEYMGCEVINKDYALTDEVDLRDHMVAMVDATHIMIPHNWWASATGHPLVLIGLWLGLRFIDEYGDTTQPKVPDEHK